jgi:predicted MFS family arabinose efflux permease
VRVARGLDSAAGLLLMLGAMTAGHLLLVPASGSVLALAAGLFAGGAAIAPTYAGVYAMVDRAAPEGTVTEAFAWLATAVAIGAAAGAAVAGALADGAGPQAAFALAAGAGAIAVVTTALRSATLPGLAAQPA